MAKKNKITKTNQVDLPQGQTVASTKKGLGFARFHSPNKELTNFKLSGENFFTVYRNLTDVYAVIREWRENMGAGGFRFKKPNDDDGEVSPVLEKELISILNFEMPWRLLKARIVRDFGVSGNAYLAFITNQSETKVLGLQPLDPRTISVISDKHGQVILYIQRISGHDPVIFKPDEIIHFKLDTDPNFEVFGLSPMEAMMWEAKTDIEAMLSNYYFFKNDAQPGVQYILDEQMSDDETKKAIEIIKQNFSGAQNRGKPTVLKNIKEIKQITLSHKDMDFVVGRRFTTEKVCAAYGVPKALLGYTEGMTFNNVNAMMRKFYISTIQPLEDFFAEVLNKQLMARLGLENEVKFEFISQDFEDSKDVEDRALNELRSGTITLREYRERTGKPITKEIEDNPMLDVLMLHQGASAVLLEDVGVDPILDPNDPAQTENFIKQLQSLKIKDEDQ